MYTCWQSLVPTHCSNRTHAQLLELCSLKKSLFIEFHKLATG
jgi:hypothetical protein